ncbi:hypothetical protein [Chryseobacterium sp. 2987]|uniref:hypothetical protein n=1 Tax=Chryseobacterium sp. 2987 TaxID=2817767 RepID=UPI002863A7C8|nr:hypothetical protein [Chryseobacterium sp. 2987]MDR6923300.1 hypothetical protein [Chryseobacterium sp. 2987]
MDHLHGKVKSVKEYVSDTIREETLYTPEGQMSEKKLYRKGVLTSIEKRYGKEGMQVRELHRLGKNMPDTIVYHFTDPSGNLNKKETYDLNGNFLEEKKMGSTFITYNSTGKLVSFIKDGITLFTKQFNAQNQALEEISFTDSGEEWSVVTYSYAGNSITKKTFDAEKRLVRLKYLVLDEKKRILQSFAFSRYDIHVYDLYELYNKEITSRITPENFKNIISDGLPEQAVFPLQNNGLYRDEIKNLLEEFRYDMNGALLPGYPPIHFFNELITLGYDESDREIYSARFVYWPDFDETELTQLEFSENKYDDRGLLTAHTNTITEKNYDFGGSYTYTYEFDGENRVIKKIKTGRSSSITAVSYENGNRIEVEQTEDHRRFTHIFDPHNNLIYYEDASERENEKWSQSYEITYYE